MSTDPDTILLECEDSMSKGVTYLKHEYRGLRTGRASTALVDYLKVEYYGTASDLKNIAAVSVPEPTQILIKPFDPSAVGEIRKAIESSGLGLNPMVEDKQIRLSIPALSTDRRKQLVAQCKKLGEETKVVLRNARRDANKHADQLKKDAAVHISEDEIETLKTEVQDLLKKYEAEVEQLIEEKGKEIMEV